MEALHARKDLQKILDMFKQLEPALEFDDGKATSKSMSRNRDDASNASRTFDSNPLKQAAGVGGENNLGEHSGGQTDQDGRRQRTKSSAPPISEVISQSITPASATESLSERKRQARLAKDPYKSKLTKISQERVNSESDSDREYGIRADQKSPLEKLIDLKLEYGMKNNDIEEYLRGNKHKFVTFQSSLMKPQQEWSHPVKPHVNPKKHLIKPRPEKKEPVVAQKQSTLKKSMKLSLNDSEILDNLKERLLQYMGDEKEDEDKKRARTLKAFGKEQITMSTKRAKSGIYGDQLSTNVRRKQISSLLSQKVTDDYTEKASWHKGKTVRIPRNKSSEFNERPGTQGQYPNDYINGQRGGVAFGLEGPTLGRQGYQESGTDSMASPKSSSQHLRMQKTMVFSNNAQSISDRLSREIRRYQTRAGMFRNLRPNSSLPPDVLDPASMASISGAGGSPKSPKNKPNGARNELRASSQDNTQLYKILRNLNSKNLESKKNQMRNQLNEAHCRTKQKEQRLQDLYHQLEELTHLNINEEVASMQAEKDVKPHVRSLLDADKCYQHTVQDTLMDADATSGHFDYSSISSILQRKQVLLQKLTVVEKKQKEEENLNAQYLKQKQKLELRNLVEGRQIDLAGQKEQNLHTVAEELSEVNIIENQRKYHVDSLLYRYKKEIHKDQQLMDKIEEEKMVMHKNQEEETKQILHEMLNHLRDIKDLKKGLMQIEEQKQNNVVKEQEIIGAFNKRKEEIDLLNQISQLKKIEEYSKKLDEIGMNGDINDDSQRLKGLDLVDQLKEKLKSSKLVPRFQSDDKKEQNHSSSSKDARAMKAAQASRRTSHTKTPPNLGKDSHVVSSGSSSLEQLRGPTQMHDQDQFPVITQLEDYIEHKQQYDQFYQEYYRQAMSVDIQGVVQTYLQSNTKLKYLQNGFKSREQDKMQKVIDLQKIQKYHEHLKEEKKLVGDYLHRIGFNQEHKIHDIFNFEHSDPTDPDGDQIHEPNSRLPSSTEVMQMYVDGLQQKDVTLLQMVAGLKGLINQFYSQFRYQIRNGVGMLKTIQKQASNIMVIQDNDEITSLVARYISGTEKHSVTQNEKASKWGSIAKQGPRRKQSVSKGIQKEESQGSQNSRMSRNSQTQPQPQQTLNADLNLASNDPECQDQKDKYGGKFDQYVKKMGHLTDHLAINQIFLILDIRILVQILSGSKLKIIFSPKYQKRSKNDSRYQANLNYADFDPIFRKKEFPSIQKNVIKKLQLNRHLSQIEKKQLIQNLKQSKELTYNMEPDEDTVEFLQQPKGRAWRNINDAYVEEEMDHNKYHSEGSDEELTKSELAAVQAHIQSAFANLTKDKRDNQIKQQMNELFRQKHHAQAVQRNERTFILDLKSRIEDRYSDLRNSFQEEYCDVYKEKKRSSKTAHGHQRARTIDNNESNIRDGHSTLSTHQSQRVSSKLHNPNYVYQKQDAGSEEAIISPIQRQRNFPGRWINYSTIEEASMLDYKPLKSLCFDMERKKAPPAASIKERIKINKNLTRHTLNTLRPKVSQSLHFRPTARHLLNDSALMTMQSSMGDNTGHALSAFQMSQPSTGTDRVARNLQELSKHAAAARNSLNPGRTSQGQKPISFAWNLANSGYSSNMNFNTQYGTVTKQHEKVNKFIQQKQKKYSTHLYNTYVKRSTNSPRRLKERVAVPSPTRRYNRNKTKAALDNSAVYYDEDI